MKSFRKIVTMGLVVSTLVLSASAFGGNNRGGMNQQGMMQQGQGSEMGQQGMQKGKRGGNPIGKLLKEINLSEEQLASLKELSETFKAQREENKGDKSAKDQALADAISESGLDTSILIQSEQEHFEVKSAIRAKNLAQIIDILTSAQRLELKALLEAKATQSSSPLENLGY